MYLCSQRFQGTGIVYEISGQFRQERPPSAPDPGAPSAVAGLGAGRSAPGLPIGIEVARRISIQSLIRTGLALGITLDKAATVRVRLTARLKTRNGRRRRMTLATATRRPGKGHTTLRIKPTKAQARLLRGRRQALTATIEVTLTTPGAPKRVLRATVRLRPDTT